MRWVNATLRSFRVVVPLGLGLLLVGSVHTRASHHQTSGSSPNIVLILTDDQSWNTLWAMPNVQADLIEHGVTFDNAFVVNSLCCPSRASILTGQYSHSTRIYRNLGSYGGFTHFQDASTIAVWLQEAGYHTGLVGKYLNGYLVNYVPPGWGRWVAFTGSLNGGDYYNYTLNIDGADVFHGDAEADYSTNVLASEADAFIRSTPTDQPLFLYFAPYAPHGPSTPAPEYAGAFDDLEPYRPPNYNEEDVSDKPAWVQELRPLSPMEQERIDGNRQNRFRALLSVDDAVHTIVTALSDTGRLSNTMVVYLSDNGFSFGEHRWNNKQAAYDEDIRVPLVIRYDPVVNRSRTDPHLVANIDLAPTFSAAAGVDSPGAEGANLLPLLGGTAFPWRDVLLIEHLANQAVPTYCAVRDELHSYVVYETGEEELYDLTLDPYQLDNAVTDPGYASALSALRTQTQQLCQPPPPDFVFPYDAVPPTIPTNLEGVAQGPDEVVLRWTASTDNVAVASYVLFRNSALLASIDGSLSRYLDDSVEPAVTYVYTVSAVDAAGNHSPMSDPVTVTTPP